jgi:hypothetical protein
LRLLLSRSGLGDATGEISPLEEGSMAEFLRPAVVMAGLGRSGMLVTSDEERKLILIGEGGP